MNDSEMQEVVRIVTDSVMAAVERRISSLGVSVRPATVTSESPLMVRLDGAKTPAPARVSGELSVGSRVLVLSSGTTLSVIGGSDGGDVEVSDLADGFVLPVARGGTGAASAPAACTSLGAAPRSAALMYKGALSSADNMNSVTETGIYYVGSSYPSNWCGTSWAYVIVVAGSGVVHQMCVGLGPSNYHERHYSGSPATWSGWQRVISPYSLPAATSSTRGGVRVGSGLKVSGDVLSVDNGAYVKSGDWHILSIGKFRIVTRLYTCPNAYVNNTWGSWLYSAAIACPNYPFTFASRPYSSIEYVYADSGYQLDCMVLRQSSNNSTTTAGNFYLVRPSGASGTVGHPVVAILAAGYVA